MFGLVNVSFSLSEWQAVKMTFFAPCRPPVDSTNYWNGSVFQISLQPDWQIDNWLFSQANHGTYSNSGTQVEAQIKDFGTGSQRDYLGATWVNLLGMCSWPLRTPNPL